MRDSLQDRQPAVAGEAGAVPGQPCLVGRLPGPQLLARQGLHRSSCQQQLGQAVAVQGGQAPPAAPHQLCCRCALQSVAAIGHQPVGAVHRGGQEAGVLGVR